MRGHQETSVQAHGEVVLSGAVDVLRERCYEIILDLYTSTGAPIIFEITESYKEKFPGNDEVYANDLAKRVSELLAEGRIVYGNKRRSPRSSKLCFECIPTNGDRKMIAEARITTLEREIRNAELLLASKYEELEALREEIGGEWSDKLTNPQKIASLTSLIGGTIEALRNHGHNLSAEHFETAVKRIV